MSQPVHTHEVHAPDGRTLAVVEGGDPDGVPVLVHHGTPCSGLLHDDWLADADAHGIRLVGWDRAGYGTSARQAGRTVAAAAYDAAAVADALDIGEFTTWGVSGGGPHALACAALLPVRCRAAVSVAGVAPYEGAEDEWTSGMGEDNLTEFAAAMQGEDVLRGHIEASAAQMRPGLESGDVDALVEEMSTLLPAVDADWLRRNGRFMIDWTQRGIAHGIDGWLDDDLAFGSPWGLDLSATQVPVLLMQGDLDKMVPFAHVDLLAAAMPSAEVRRLLGDGHLTLLDRVPEIHAWLLQAWNA